MKISGKSIDRAGNVLRKKESERTEEEFSEAIEILSHWRFSHEKPLDSAFSVLEEVTLKRDKNAIFAKRLKRAPSIAKKLRRFDGMTLRSMQDIGGCRAVLSSEKKLTQVLRELKKLTQFKWKNGLAKVNDYIKHPKADGYRSIHLIGKFTNLDGETRRIEIQLRTYIQHHWATALEIVDLFTGQALKSNEGEEDWKHFFSSVSEQFALMDEIHLYQDLPRNRKFFSYRQKLRQHRSTHFESKNRTQILAKKLKVLKKLDAFSNSLKIIDKKLTDQSQSGYVLLRIEIPKTTLHSFIFSSQDAIKAEKMYKDFEKEFSNEEDTVVALVSTTSVGDIKDAYPNYFADSTEFIHHLNFILQA